MSCTTITDLPEECISHILSLTSPIDIVRSSVVSKQFLSASEFDVVWNKFLPWNLDEIVSQSSTPGFFQQYLSKKQQFSYLCSSHLLFDNDTKSFALNKWSGKKCYMLGARALFIVWGIDTPQYWTWNILPESRFPEIAKLLGVCWLLIEAGIDPTTLSQNTTYGAYFVYKMDANYDRGFESSTPVKAFVYETFPKEDGTERPHHDVDDVPLRSLCLKARRGTRPEEELPYARNDGWMEIEMGRYYVGDCVNDKSLLKLIFREYDYGHWKGGLIVHGIELRPLD